MVKLCAAGHGPALKVIARTAMSASVNDGAHLLAVTVIISLAGNLRAGTISVGLALTTAAYGNANLMSLVKIICLLHELGAQEITVPLATLHVRLFALLVKLYMADKLSAPKRSTSMALGIAHDEACLGAVQIVSCSVGSRNARNLTTIPSACRSVLDGTHRLAVMVVPRVTDKCQICRVTTCLPLFALTWDVAVLGIVIVTHCLRGNLCALRLAVGLNVSRITGDEARPVVLLVMTSMGVNLATYEVLVRLIVRATAYAEARRTTLRVMLRLDGTSRPAEGPVDLQRRTPTFHEAHCLVRLVVQHNLADNP
mmetsp:Transcript_78976/g.198457  ORF Transcript_78976/g.198457 Transcript_78976/m.198457 type:complete len:312 (-) Transcript_78976:1361-2296(-)